MAQCYRHPNVETYRICSRCERPSCSDCLSEAPVGFQCVECVKRVTPGATDRVVRTVKVNKRLALSAMPVTKVLIAVNVVIYIMGVSGAKWAQSEQLGVAGVFIANLHEYYRLVTSGFLHYGLLHLGFNMYCLWGLAQSLEERLGPKRFLGVYLVGLLGGSAGAMLVEPKGLTGGASGAVFGLFGALAVALQSRGISVLKSPLGPTLLINFFITFAIPGISKGGHVGGFIFGAIAGFVTLRPNKRGETEWQDLGALLVVAMIAVGLALAFAQRGGI